MDNEALKREREQNLIDALSFREPKKVPIGAEVLTWPFSFAGVRYIDIIDDPAAVAREYVKFLDVIDLDFIWGANVTTAVNSLRALGNTSYSIGDDGVSLIHMQPDVEFISADEYPALIKDPLKFGWELTKRRCAAFKLPKAEAYAKVIESLLELDKWSTANSMISRYISEEKGIIPLTGAPVGFMSPLTAVFDRFRGVRDTLVDLRRRPDMLRAVHSVMIERKREELLAYDPKNFTSPYPLGSTVYHVECFISPPQFDEFFFDPFMELMLPYMEAGLKFFVKGEGKFLNTIDRYRKLPKGAVVFMLDEDDPFAVYDAIGDWQSVATGITADLLKMGTREQCIDYVKKCFETFAPGGGFIFMQNKPLLCAGDAKTENLIAVYETANELSVK